MNVAAMMPVRKLARWEYDRLVEMGWFKNERVELIDGILVDVSPQGFGHAEVVTRLTDWFPARLVGRARVRIQLPLGVGQDSEPEPDVAIVPLAEYTRAHPETAHLVIEVADSSATVDRTIKSSVYAQGAIPEYWIVDLQLHLVEVFREPHAGGYTSVTRVGVDGTVAPLAFPDLVLAVGELLRGI